MASHSFLIQHEDKIIKLKADLDEIRQAYNAECKSNGTRPNRENEDVWGTLKTNLIVVRNQIDALVTTILPGKSEPR